MWLNPQFHAYWRNPKWKTSFFMQCQLSGTLSVTLREKCSYSEFFYFIFSRILTEYRDLRIKSKYGKIRNRKTPNTDTFHVAYS